MKTAAALLIFSVMFAGLTFAQSTQSQCEFECKNQLDSAKFECSVTWPDQEQQINKENCLRDANNEYRMCKSTCI